jgi:hypothetical protein
LPSARRDCSSGHDRLRDLLLRDAVAAQLLHHGPSGEDDHPIAEALELECVRRDHEHRCAGLGNPAEDAVDLDTRARIDSLSGLVREHERGLGEQRAGEHDLLLVPSRQSGDLRVEARRSNPQRLPLALDRGDLGAAAENAVPGVVRKRRKRCVLADGHPHQEALRMPVGRQVRHPCLPRLVRVPERQPAHPELRLAARPLQAGECAKELALAVSLDAGEAHDLARIYRERHPLEAVARHSLDREAGPAAVLAAVLRGKRGVDGPPDDETQDLVVRELLERCVRSHLAVAQDRDPIGDLPDLGQAM